MPCPPMPVMTTARSTIVALPCAARGGQRNPSVPALEVRPAAHDRVGLAPRGGAFRLSGANKTLHAARCILHRHPWMSSSHRHFDAPSGWHLGCYSTCRRRDKMNAFLAALPPILFGALQLAILMAAIRVTRAERERRDPPPPPNTTLAHSDADFPPAALAGEWPPTHDPHPRPSGHTPRQ